METRMKHLIFILVSLSLVACSGMRISNITKPNIKRKPSSESTPSRIISLKDPKELFVEILEIHPGFFTDAGDKIEFVFKVESTVGLSEHKITTAEFMGKRIIIGKSKEVTELLEIPLTLNPNLTTLAGGTMNRVAIVPKYNEMRVSLSDIKAPSSHISNKLSYKDVSLVFTFGEEDFLFGRLAGVVEFLAIKYINLKHLAEVGVKTIVMKDSKSKAYIKVRVSLTKSSFIDPCKFLPSCK